MKKLLMCSPECFAVNYEINPWMLSNIGKVDHALATQQWNALVKVLSENGSEVNLMGNQPMDLPDIVFTANAALTINGHALVSYFACEQRRGESVIYEQKLHALGMQTDMACVQEKVAFEGAGDALLHRQSKQLVLAHGFRTSLDAHALVSKFLDKAAPEVKLLSVELVNSSYYHLDTCFCPLDNGLILYYPKAFSVQSVHLLQEKFAHQLVEVDETDASAFACNAVSINDSVILSQISEKLLTQLQSYGLKVYACPLSQFMLSGGSAKCLTLELSQASPSYVTPRQ